MHYRRASRETHADSPRRRTPHPRPRGALRSPAALSAGGTSSVWAPPRLSAATRAVNPPPRTSRRWLGMTAALTVPWPACSASSWRSAPWRWTAWAAGRCAWRGAAAPGGTPRVRAAGEAAAPAEGGAGSSRTAVTPRTAWKSAWSAAPSASPADPGAGAHPPTPAPHNPTPFLALYGLSPAPSNPAGDVIGWTEPRPVQRDVTQWPKPHLHL